MSAQSALLLPVLSRTEAAVSWPPPEVAGSLSSSKRRVPADGPPGRSLGGRDIDGPNPGSGVTRSPRDTGLAPFHSQGRLGEEAGAAEPCLLFLLPVPSPLDLLPTPPPALLDLKPFTGSLQESASPSTLGSPPVPWNPSLGPCRANWGLAGRTRGKARVKGSRPSPGWEGEEGGTTAGHCRRGRGTASSPAPPRLLSGLTSADTDESAGPREFAAPLSFPSCPGPGLRDLESWRGPGGWVGSGSPARGRAAAHQLGGLFLHHVLPPWNRGRKTSEPNHWGTRAHSGPRSAWGASHGRVTWWRRRHRGQCLEPWVPRAGVSACHALHRPAFTTQEAAQRPARPSTTVARTSVSSSWGQTTWWADPDRDLPALPQPGWEAHPETPPSLPRPASSHVSSPSSETCLVHTPGAVDQLRCEQAGVGRPGGACFQDQRGQAGAQGELRVWVSGGQRR